MIASLNKYYGHVSKDEYWHEWDLKTTNNAIALSNFPEPVQKWIWEKKRNKNRMHVEFSKPIRRVKNG